MSSPSKNGLANRPQAFDGEGVDPQDFDALSTGLRLSVNDLVVSSMMRLNLAVTSPIGAFGSSECPPTFALEHSGAPRNGGGNLGYTCNPGPLFQTGTSANVGVLDGVTPKIKSYYLTSGEISGTFAAADATHPRFDAIYVRLTEVDGALVTRDFEDALGHVTSQSFATTKQAQLEYVVVQGTPATIPTIGAAPDNTWSLWGAWWIPATYNAPFTLGQIFDWRYPLGIKRFQVHGNALTTDPSGWTYDGVNDEWASASGNHGLYARCPVRSGRVLGMNWAFRAQSGATDDRYLLIQGYGIAATAATATTVPAGAFGEPNYNMLSTEMNKWSLRGGLWMTSSTPLTPANAKSPTNHYQLLPLWANGYGSCAEDGKVAGGGEGDGSSLRGPEDRKVIAQAFRVGAGSTITSCVFDVAGGV